MERDPHRFDTPLDDRVPVLQPSAISSIKSASKGHLFKIEESANPQVLHVWPQIMVALSYVRYPGDGTSEPYAALMIQDRNNFFSLMNLKCTLVPCDNDAFWGVEEISGITYERCISMARFTKPAMGALYSLKIEGINWDHEGATNETIPPLLNTLSMPTLRF